jgi:isopenicillin-N synthase
MISAPNHQDFSAMGDDLEVPVIDVAPLAGHDERAKLQVARQIDTACRGPGFFYAANHCIDLTALERVTRDFHSSLSSDEKFRLAIHAYNTASPRSRSGYYMAVEGKKANESFCYLTPSFTERHPRIRAATPLHEVNVWPEDAGRHGWREFYEQYYQSVFELSARLLRGFALALGKQEDFFDAYFRLGDTLSAVSLIRYPYLDNYPPVKIAADGTRLSFEHHQDVSLITVLYQTPVPNLQALTSATYRNVPTSGEAFLVNCGSYMSYITKDFYPSPVHRVAFINTERLSIPFFVHLGYDDAVEPLSLGKTARRNTKAMTYGNYLGKGLGNLIISNGQT